ncbi:MAG: transposase [Cyclobacteriaceae bacterium]
MTRKKYTSKFKTKVVLEAIKEHSTAAGLAQKHDLAPQQINLWKRFFLANADSVFERKGKSNNSRSAGMKVPMRKEILI